MQIATSLPSSVTLPALIAPISGKSQSVEQALTTSSMIILFGRDDRGRPHGSRFERLDKAEVEQAALMMDFQLIEAGSKELRDLGAKLPVGRIFPASGKAFVAFVKAALFDRLIAATGAPDTPRAASGVLKPAEGGALPGGAVAGALVTPLPRHRPLPTGHKSISAALCWLRATTAMTATTPRR